MLRKSSPPIEPRRRDAPITATALGAKKGRSEATTAVWSRSSTRDASAPVAATGKRELDLAALTCAPELESGVREHCQRRRVRRHHLGDEPVDAGVARPAGELLEQAGADPAALFGVVDGERHLGRFAPADTCVAPDRDDALFTVAVGEPAGERAALRPVRIEQRLDQCGLDPAESVEAQVPALVGQTLEEARAERRAVCGQRGP